MGVTTEVLTKPGKTAFLVVHGVGQHEKYEALSYFAAGLMRSIQLDAPPERILVPFKDCIESALSLKSQGHRVDILEYYYQPSLLGVVKKSEVTGFIFLTLERIRKLSRQLDFRSNREDRTHGDNPKQKADNDLSAWYFVLTHPKSIPSFLLLGLARGLYRLWSWMPNLLQRPFEWLGSVVIQNDVLEVVGDMVAYLAINPKARLNSKRSDILCRCEQRISELLSKTGEDGYDQVVVAGHSLGSVVSYDALSWIARDVACGRFDARMCDKLSGFISFGSPLDKVAFLFWPTLESAGQGYDSSWEKLRSNVYAGMLPHFYGIRSSKALGLRTDVLQPKSSALDGVKWLNFYSDRDLISGSLDAYDDVENVKIGVPDKDVDIWNAFTDHSFYWESKEMFDSIVTQFLDKNKLQQTESPRVAFQQKSTSPKNNAFFTDKKRPFILGHRGVPMLHQENTLAGFHRALELGVDGVEFDVFKTRDDRIVVFHDEDTERLTGVKGNITEMTWDEVSKLRIQKRVDMGGGKFVTFSTEQRIPLLEEVLEEFKGKLLMNVEMKAFVPNWLRRHTGTEVARTIRRCNAENSVIVTSFDFFMLYYLEREYPGLHSGFAYDDGMMDNAIGDWFRKVPEIETDLSKAPGNQNDLSFLNFVLEANAVGSAIGSTLVDVEHTLIDTDTVANFKAKGMLTGAYTVFPLDTRYERNPEQDQVEVVRRLMQYQVDWLETDDPERVLELCTSNVL